MIGEIVRSLSNEEPQRAMGIELLDADEAARLLKGWGGYTVLFRFPPYAISSRARLAMMAEHIRVAAEADQ